MLHSIFDVFPWWLLLLILIAIFMVVLEFAFRLTSRRRRDRSDGSGDGDSHDSHAADVRDKGDTGRSGERRRSSASLILGSLLAMLSLLLAFGFGIAESRFQTRKQLVLEEANAIQTTYLRASMLPPAHAERTRELLRHYVADRISKSTVESLPELLAGSARIHKALWDEAMASATEVPDSRYIPLYIQSLNEVLDLHESRLTHAAYYRMPAPALAALLVVAVLAIAVLGHVLGLADARSFWPALAIVTAIATIVVLIVDLDRPWNRLFPVSNQSMVDVQSAISE